jgi:uncharacterized protein YjiS (DUF1127 family)
MNTRSLASPRGPAPSAVSTTGRRARAWMRRSMTRLVAQMIAWQQRARERAQLRAMGERELRDLGLTRGDVLVETDKPFWRL